jgi:hypothetical protein
VGRYEAMDSRRRTTWKNVLKPTFIFITCKYNDSCFCNADGRTLNTFTLCTAAVVLPSHT